MKKFLLLLLVFGVLVSCNSQTNDYVKSVEVADFKEFIKSLGVQLIDVRTPEEFKQGAIKDAVLMNFFADNFKENVAKLNKDKPVYLYCKSGRRSKKASEIFVALGFKEIYDLKGGYNAWKTK